MRTPSPSVAPSSSCSTNSSTSCTHDEHWRRLDNSVSAMSFGLVATAILISMFLVMALFERLLRSPTTAAAGNHGDLHTQYLAKLQYSSTQINNIYASEVSVLMPGDETPTFIANPVPSV
ncbi:hypothetical protein R6Q57_029732 [Mikania cordata]